MFVKKVSSAWYMILIKMWAFNMMTMLTFQV